MLRQRGRVSAPAEQLVVTGFAIHLLVTLLERKARRRVGVQVEAMRREAVACMAAQAAAVGVKGVVKLPLMHVLMAGGAGVRRPAGIGLGEALAGIARMTGGAVQAVVRRIQREAAGAPGRTLVAHASTEVVDWLERGNPYLLERLSLKIAAAVSLVPEPDYSREKIDVGVLQ